MTVRVYDQPPRNILGIVKLPDTAMPPGELLLAKGGAVEDMPVNATALDFPGGGRQMVGEVSIDLEDRWLAYKRALYSASREDTQNAPKVLMSPFIHKTHNALESLLGPLRPFPLEHLPLTKSFSSQHVGLPTGSVRYARYYQPCWFQQCDLGYANELRLWVDFSQDGVAYEELPVNNLGRSHQMERFQGRQAKERCRRRDRFSCT